MPSSIKIKRSGSTSGAPASLGQGELAYTWKLDTRKLYIGTGTETNGAAANIEVIGGSFFTDMLSHTPGTLTANSAIIVDGDKKINDLYVDNIQINGNTISSTDSNGNINITPDANGKIILDGQAWPNAIGTDGYFLKTDALGVLSWASIPLQSFTITGDTGTDVITTGETLTVVGTDPIDTAVTDNTITISAKDASTSQKGVASFNADTFSVTAGAVSVKAAGITNTQLVNSAVTFGSTTVSLGGTSTSLAGVTQLTVDNIDINGNTISSTDVDGNIILDPNGTGSVNVSNSRIINVSEPIADTDAATKYYVDAARSGLTVKQSVNAATTESISLSGEQTVDGVALVSGNRVLVKDQSNGIQNGIWVVATGSWTRSTDADNTPGGEVSSGMFTFVEAGTINGGCGFVLLTSGPVSLGTTALDFGLFSSSGTLLAGNGLSKNGNLLEVNVAANGGIELVADSLQLKSTVAGSGLTISSGVLSVGGTADRISVSADSVDIASTYIGQSSITTVGILTSGELGTGFSTVNVPQGGTGSTSFTVNGIVYGNGVAGMQSTTAGPDGYFLYSNAGTPAWTSTVDGGVY